MIQTVVLTSLFALGTVSMASPFYTVRSGDTLSQIATRNKISTDELQKLNNIANADRIYPGQKISIPVATASSAAPLSANKPVKSPYAAALTASAPAPWSPSQELRQQIWEAEQMGPGRNATNFDPFPTEGQTFTAYKDPGLKNPDGTDPYAIAGGVRYGVGERTFSKNQEVGYSDWSNDFDAAITRARDTSLKKYPKFSSLPTPAQNILIQHAYTSPAHTWNNFYKAVLSGDIEGIRREYPLRVTSPGIKYRNQYYNSKYIEPLIKNLGSQ